MVGIRRNHPLKFVQLHHLIFSVWNLTLFEKSLPTYLCRCEVFCKKPLPDTLAGGTFDNNRRNEQTGLRNRMIVFSVCHAGRRIDHSVHSFATGVEPLAADMILPFKWLARLNRTDISLRCKIVIGCHADIRQKTYRLIRSDLERRAAHNDSAFAVRFVDGNDAIRTD